MVRERNGTDKRFTIDNLGYIHFAMIPVLHFAFAHNQASFNSAIQNSVTAFIYLQSTTMDKMRANTASRWTMVKTQPTNILFFPRGTQGTFLLH